MEKQKLNLNAKYRNLVSIVPCIKHLFHEAVLHLFSMYVWRSQISLCT